MKRRTLLGPILNFVHDAPQVTEVVEVQDESQLMGESEFSKLESQLSA